MTPFTLFGFTCFEIEVLVMAAMASAAGAAEESVGGNVNPLLQSSWGITDPDLANFGSAINVAHGVSNVAVAIAADSFGRRKKFLACLALFSAKSSGLLCMYFIQYWRDNTVTLSATYPEMISDQKLGTARLCVSTILAKINTLEWTRLC